MNKYSITEHTGTLLFPDIHSLNDHIRSIYVECSYNHRKKSIEVVCNGAVVGVIKKIRV